MAPVESTVLESIVLETAGFGAGAFGADWRGFFAALAVLCLALAVLVTVLRATFFVALPFVFFRAITVSFFCL